MQFLTKTKYLQVYRKNDVSTVYYELMTKKFIEYINHEKSRPSFMYYIGIPVALFLGSILDIYWKVIVSKFIFLKTSLIIIGVAIAFMLFQTINRKINEKIKNEGYEISITCIEEEQIKLGLRQLKQQNIIIILFAIFDFILLFLFYFTNAILVWIIFEGGLICIVAMIASVRPHLRKKMYKNLIR